MWSVSCNLFFLDLPIEYQRLAGEHDSIFYDNTKTDPDGFRAWSTQFQFNVLENSEDISLDATFGKPNGYRQVLIISGKVNRQTVPSVYVYMLTKSKRAYINVLKWLKKKIVSRFLHFLSSKAKELLRSDAILRGCDCLSFHMSIK